jgi:TrmH family RNA methyltransferase
MSNDNIRIVLVEPTHPGNIGATARAMGNMGLRRLHLVSPAEFRTREAYARAAGANWILDEAVVTDSVSQAVAECDLLIATTARPRAVDWPTLSPRQAATELVEASRTGQVGILFGRESRGLKNAEIDHCQYLVHIPADGAFSSLNLASAVLLMAYEMRLQTVDDSPPSPLESAKQWPANAEQMERFYRHLQTTLDDIDFIKATSSIKLMRKITRIFNRARLTVEEINILRGILSAVQQRRQ